MLRMLPMLRAATACWAWLALAMEEDRRNYLSWGRVWTCLHCLHALLHCAGPRGKGGRAGPACHELQLPYKHNMRQHCRY